MKTDLEWLLTASGLKGLKCVACKNLLRTKFDGVCVIENPKSIRWVKQDELAVTTGYFIAGSTEKQRQMICELKKAGCTALGIKIKSYFQEIPQSMVEEAEKTGLPLFEIPYYYSLSEISQTVYHRIFEINYQGRIKEQKLIEDISDIFFQKRGVMEMIYRIAEYLKRTVILMDTDFQCIYAAKRMRDKNLCYIGSGIKKVGSSNDAHDLFVFSENVQKRGYCVVIQGSKYKAILLIVEEEKNLTSDEKEIIKRCTKILSMGLEQVKIKQEEKHEFEDLYYQDLYDYLNGLKDYPKDELKTLFYETEIPLEKKRIMLFIQVEKGGAYTNYRGVIQRCIANSKELRQTKTCMFLQNNRFVLYIFTEPDRSNPQLCYTAKKLADRIMKQLSEKYRELDIKIGISKSSSDLEGMKRAYEEAGKAINIGERLNIDEKIFEFRKLSVYDYMFQYPLKTKEEFSDDIYYLIQYDKENNTDLTQTLLGFLEYKFNVSETSKALYIHRNTLMNRLNKIRELLYNEMETMDDLLPLCIEAYAYKIL